MRSADKLKILKRLARSVKHLSYERRNASYFKESPEHLREQMELNGYLSGIQWAMVLIALMPERPKRPETRGRG